MSTTLNFSKPIHLVKASDVAVIHQLIKKPPIHSVVLVIEPDASREILNTYNTRNRSFKPRNIRSITGAVASGVFGRTGDTIKFSKTGVLIDGQHRLKGSVDARRPLETHAVFGLEDEVFDILDQGAKRTAADVLRMDGQPDPTWVASAVRWVIAIHKGTIPRHLTTSNREIRELVEGKHRKVVEFLPHARQVYQLYRHSPSFLTALFYTIAHKDKELEEKFVDAWLRGNRTGRNENFSVLQLRMMSVNGQRAGDPYIRAAATVNMFNHWNAGLVVTPKAMAWQPHQKFPALVFDGPAFKRQLVEMPVELTSNQRAVLETLLKAINGHRKVQMSMGDMASNSGVNRGAIPAIIESLSRRELIRLIEQPTNTEAAVYKILGGAE